MGVNLNSSNIRIVLVNTTHPGNIGGAARAMKNMGLQRLVLVAPRKFPHEEADWRAASAGDVLESAEVVDSLDEAIADCQLVIGTSARGRRIPWPVLDPRNCAQRALAAADLRRATLQERKLSARRRFNRDPRSGAPCAAPADR